MQTGEKTKVRLWPRTVNAIKSLEFKRSVRYVVREVGKALKKSYTKYYILGFLVLCILANVAMACFRQIYGLNDGSFSYNLIIFAEGVFVIPYYSCIFLADMVFGKEYPDPHIKDGYTSRLRKWQLYFGNFVASLVLGVVMYFITFVLLLSTTALFSLGEVGIGFDTVLDFLQKSMVAMPLWTAGIAIGHCMLFTYRSKKKAFIMFYVIVLLIPRLIILLASERIRLFPFTALMDFIITPQFQALQFFFTMDFGKCLLLGFVYSVLFTIIGIRAFYKNTSY